MARGVYFQLWQAVSLPAKMRALLCLVTSQLDYRDVLYLGLPL